MALVPLEARMVPMVHRLGRAGLVDVGIDDGHPVDLDGDLPAFGGNLFRVPLADRLQAAALRRDDAVDGAVELVRLEVRVLRVRVFENLDFHALIGGVARKDRPDPKAVVGAGRKLELESHGEVAVLIGGVDVAGGLRRVADHLAVFGVVAVGVARPAGHVPAVEQRDEALQLLLGGQNLPDVDVPEVEEVAVVLQFDLAGGVDGLLPVPIVLHDDVVHDKLAIEIDRHLFPDHDDAEAVPLADGLVRQLRRLARVLLVVVQASGADLSAGYDPACIPNLDLRRASQVDAAVAAFLDLPVHEHLEIAVVLGGAEAAALAVENERAIGSLPVRPHVLIGLLLELLRLIRGQGRPFVRIVIRALQESLPAGQVLAVEQGHKALRGLVQRLLCGLARLRRECRQKRQSRNDRKTYAGVERLSSHRDTFLSDA